jgi:hypothetical protein
VVEGLRLLAHLIETTMVPVPHRISYSVLADTDDEGAAAIDRIGLELERAGIAHQVHDIDYSRTLTIPLAKGLEYQICYVYEAAMADHRARESYYTNIV